jgi:hypothetical protein
MGMQPQFCANKNCKKHTVHTGGRFRFKVSTGETFCEDCFTVAIQFDSAKNLYDYTTTHFNGEKIHIRDKNHMRKLEKQFGVSSVIANNMERNWDRHG